MEGVIQGLPKRNVLSCFLNFTTDCVTLRLRDRSFQIIGAATLKDLSSDLFLLLDLTCGERPY